MEEGSSFSLRCPQRQLRPVPSPSRLLFSRTGGDGSPGAPEVRVGSRGLEEETSTTQARWSASPQRPLEGSAFRGERADERCGPRAAGRARKPVPGLGVG